MRALIISLTIFLIFCFFPPAGIAQNAQPFEQYSSSSIAALLFFDDPLYFEIIIEDCVLIAYKQKLSGELEKIAEFRTATVSKKEKLFPLGMGFITKVELNPAWYPTPSVVKKLNKKLIAQGKKPTYKKGMRIPPGDPRNAMGTFKMFLSHHVPGDNYTFRIHGTNSPKSIGKRESKGCVRMNDEDGFPLAQNVQERMNKKGQKVWVNIMLTRKG